MPTPRPARDPARPDTGGTGVHLACPVNIPFEAVTGLWEPDISGDGGLVLGTNLGLSQCILESGQCVAVLEETVCITRQCKKCKCSDTDAWTARDCTRCAACKKLKPGKPRNCRGCGAPFAMCEIAAVGNVCECHFGATETRSAALALVTKADPQVAHIVEDPVGMATLSDVEVPTDYYYEKYNDWLWHQHPRASPEIIEHLVSLTAFLDVSILSGFSYGSAKSTYLCYLRKGFGSCGCMFWCYLRT